MGGTKREREELFSCFYAICAGIKFFGEVGHFTERSGFLELSSAKS